MPLSSIPIPLPTHFEAAHDLGVPPKSPTSTPASTLESRPRRRQFSAAEKLRILEEVERAPRGGQGEILRKYNIYSSHLVQWRKALGERGREGLAQRPGPKSAHAPEDAARIRELETQLAATQKELRIVNELNALQKKVSMLLGISLAVPPKSEES